jgi:hypothetical protein
MRRMISGMHFDSVTTTWAALGAYCKGWRILLYEVRRIQREAGKPWLDT